MLVTLDTETYDPLLTTHGPGVYRKDGYVLGASVCFEGQQGFYLELDPTQTHESLRASNLRKLEAILSDPHTDKVFANALYDIDWLENDLGLKVCGGLHDVQIAEPLLDAFAKGYSLEALAQRYLNKGKAKTEIQDWCEAQGLKGDPRKHLYLIPPALVGAYAKVDAELPLEIIKKQLPLLEEQALMPLYDIERGLLPLLMRMRKTGVRVDEPRRQKLADTLRTKISALEAAFFKEYGRVNYNSSQQLGALLRSLGLPVSKTTTVSKSGDPLNNDSVKNVHLLALTHPIGAQLLALRSMTKNLNTFVEGSFLEYQVNGRIHGQFYPLKGDAEGTVTGRFSAQHPNLQQTPKSDDKDLEADLIGIDYGHECRSLFIPEDWHDMGKTDYSQIEYRVLAHFAIGPKSNGIREEYNTNPKTDYHKLVQDWTGLDRRPAKVINFGVAFFMGAKKMAETNGWPMDYALRLLDRYFENVPFVIPTRNTVVSVAKQRGYVKTILGRRCRVNALREHRKEYKAFPHLIQGSAADVMKKSMYDCWVAGVYDVLVPHLTVHDELVVSVPRTKEGIEAYREQKRIMETSVKLKVPVLAVAEIGPSWGEGIEIVADSERGEGTTSFEELLRSYP